MEEEGEKPAAASPEQPAEPTATADDSSSNSAASSSSSSTQTSAEPAREEAQTQTAAAAQTVNRGMSARPTTVVLGKRQGPPDGAEQQGEAESQKQRAVMGLDVCQQEEPESVEPETLATLYEAQEECLLFELQETSGGASSSTAPDPFVNIDEMVGSCAGVKDARSGAPLESRAVRAGRVKELHSMKNFSVWELRPEREARGKKRVRVK